MSSPKIFPTDFTHLSGTLTGSGFVYIDDGTVNGWVTATELLALLTSGQVTTALGFTPVSATTVGVANGVAQLDSGGHVPVAQISLALNNLTNVNAPTPSGGQVLKWDSGTSKWIPLTLPTFPTALSGDSDVVITSPASGQYLKYNGTNWINAALPTIPTTIGTLTDVNMTTGPNDTDVLSFNTATGKWIPATRPSSGTAGSVWRTGSVVPSSTLGLNTDLYLRTSNGDVYQRSSGTYSVVTNITGPTGTVPSIVDGNLVANTSGATAVPIATTVSALFDYSVSSTRGVLFFRGAAGWVTLGIGTANQSLRTGGAGADPSWITPLTSVVGAGGLAGTITTTGSLTFASIATASVLANTSGISGLPVATTPSALLDSAFSTIRGAVIFRNATGWVALAAGTSGQVLATGGTSADPTWQNASAGTVINVSGSGGLAGTITTTGSLTLASIATGNLLANTSGSSGLPVATTPSVLLDNAISSTQGSVVYRSATAWVALATGTSGQVLTTGGAAANPSWTTPAAGSVTNITGSGGLAGTVSTTGSLTLANIASGNLLANTSGVSGLPVATTPSALLDNAISSTQGSIAYRSAAGWVALGVGTVGQYLQTGGAAANPSWTTPLTIPAAGYVYSNGTVLSAGTIGNGLTLTAGNLSVASLAAGFVYSNGTILAAGSIGNGLTLVAGALSARPQSVTFGAEDASALPPGTYPLGYFPQGGTLISCTSFVRSGGTTTFTLSIGTPGTLTAVTGLSSIAISSSIPSTNTATAGNTLAAGNWLYLVTTNTGSPIGSCFTPLVG